MHVSVTRTKGTPDQSPDLATIVDPPPPDLPPPEFPIAKLDMPPPPDLPPPEFPKEKKPDPKPEPPKNTDPAS